MTQLDKGKEAVIQRNRKKLEPIIETAIFCAQNSTAFRGHRDDGDLGKKETQHAAIAGEQGIFRALLSFRVKSGDTNLKEHLETAGKNATFISKTIQNDIIESLGCYIQNRIFERVAKAKYFSILCDETTDVSTQQQLSICLRYFDDEILAVREDFVTFIHTSSATGAHLRDTIKKFLKKKGISLETLRGQGYAGGSNMKGKIKGLQALLLQDQPLAFYVHCYCHSLNLSVSKACSVTYVKNMIGIVQSVSTFLTASAKRVQLLQVTIESSGSKMPKKKLKAYCQTRWTERCDSIVVFLELYEFILQTLETIEESDDRDSASKAATYIAAIQRVDFILSLVTAASVLSLTLTLSRQLQEVNIDLCKATQNVKLVVDALECKRTNSKTEFRTLFKKAEEIATHSGVSIDVPRLARR